MSPANAMERSYGIIKEMLRNGVFAVGTRLEANRLSQEIGVSMTPVRDVLHRLVGEHLVEAAPGDGFRVPRLTESALRDLYEWNSALMTLAVRTIDVGPALAARDVSGSGSVATRLAIVVEKIAATVPNKEIGAALISASDRLHPFRMVEGQIFDNIASELDNLTDNQANLSNAIRRYHLRRMRFVPELLSKRQNNKSSSRL